MNKSLTGNETPARYQSGAVLVSGSLAVGAVQCLVDAAGDIRPFSTENRSESMTHHTSSPAKKEYVFNEQNIHEAQWEKSKLAVHSVRGCQSPVLQLRKPVIQQGAVGRHNRTGCTETEGVMEGTRG
ncbi:unnamed protein product [Leuciscus chuanchicus]